MESCIYKLVKITAQKGPTFHTVLDPTYFRIARNAFVTLEYLYRSSVPENSFIDGVEYSKENLLFYQFTVKLGRQQNNAPKNALCRQFQEKLVFFYIQLPEVQLALKRKSGVCL